MSEANVSVNVKKSPAEIYKELINSSGIEIGDKFFNTFNHKKALIELFLEIKKREKNQSETNKELDTGVVTVKNFEWAIAMRDLLEGIGQISEVRIPRLNSFAKLFDEVVGWRLPVNRSYSDKSAQIIEKFKKNIFSTDQCLKIFDDLRYHRLSIPISELFDFVLYLKASKHTSIKDLIIKDGINRYSYHYFTTVPASKSIIYLDNILYANIGLTWEDDESEHVITIDDCVKLQKERDETLLKELFIKCVNKEANLFACHALSQNIHLSESLAEHILSIIESKYQFFPYPQDYRDLIESTKINIFKHFPLINQEMTVDKCGLTFESQYMLVKNESDKVWYKGLELTSNEYAAKLMVYAKKYSESNNDYTQYLLSIGRWLWSIQLMFNNFVNDDYKIDISSTRLNSYGIFTLESVKKDEVFIYLKKNLLENQKYLKLLNKDHDFVILFELFKTICKIYEIIKKLLNGNKDITDKLYYHFNYWKTYIDDVLHDDLSLITLIEFHPDTAEEIFYSFQEILLSIRFWNLEKDISLDRLSKITKNAWKHYKDYSRLRIHSPKSHLVYLLFLTAAIIVSNEVLKNEIIECLIKENKDLKEEFIKILNEEIKNYPDSKYQSIITILKSEIDEIFIESESK